MSCEVTFQVIPHWDVHSMNTRARLSIKNLAPIPELTDRKDSRKMERKGAKQWKQTQRKKVRHRLGTMRHLRPVQYRW